MHRSMIILVALAAIPLFASGSCDECIDGDRRCHAFREEVEVCEDGKWQTEEKCYGQKDCCLQDDNGYNAECTSQCWTTSCESEPIGS